MLQEQRQRSTFDKKQLTYAIHQGKEKFEEFKKLQDIVTKDPILRFDPSFIQSARKDNMSVHAKKIIRYLKLIPMTPTMKMLQSFFFSQQLPLSLHFFMFLITLENLCSQKQVKMFLEPAKRGQILGCYAQTELAHGSDIQNLLTTATYDQSTQTFIINSPSIQASKWWIGDLGMYANHAVLFAQLIIKNKKYGLHAFLVPLRDQNHKPYPGIQVGDIGPKLGYNTKDNGYALFTNYRIPRMNLLMKYVKVTPTGQYSKKGDQRISYATMLTVRGLIPTNCFYSYTKAIVIATRYSLVRKQFKDSNNKQLPILNYQLQQDKIIPKIAESFAFAFGSQRLRQISLDVFYEVKQKQYFGRLNQTHALCSGLKAIFTNDTLIGLQALRKSCGGHGFHHYSGLPGLILELTPTATFEGQNTVLLLQTARFLLKSLKQMQKGKRLPPTVMYLQQLNHSQLFIADYQNFKDIINPQTIRKIFVSQSCIKTRKAAEKLTNAIADGIDPKQAWDYHAGLALVQAGAAHTYLWIYQNFLTEIYQRTNHERVRQVLFKLLSLYGLQKIIQKSQNFYETGVITSSTLKSCIDGKQYLLKQLRPEVLSIVDSFQYDDQILFSAIGAYDGKAYQRMLQWSKKYNPVNRPQIRRQINQVLKASLTEIKPKL